ncbi:Gti1/Pac2 family-domain-containing protein [Daedaleopsis nitida]|nr:Gti1/Pac2 family-domain-containing protein [Daedaleopsis nitida]
MFYTPAQDVQRPTHPRLHVRDARDAHIVFEAVRQGLLKPVQRRLNELERSTYIASGSLFVWEESDDEMGLKRWTDGRVWSQSRMREPYLFYDEKLGDEPPSEPKTKCTYRFVEGPSRTWTSSAQSHYERSDHHPMGLVKQAYSAWVSTSVNAKPRKWHLTAYFTYADLQNIPTVDKDPLLSSITVPQGVYRSGKARSRNSDASLSALPSPPSSPAPGGSSRPSSPLQSSTRGRKDGVVLPSLHSAIAHTPMHFAGPHHRTNPRMAEDQRMIQMLNSQPIL